MDLNILKDNLILIVPDSIKKKVLLQINNIDKIFNIKIMNLKELINKLTFTYNEEAIYYLMKKYNIKYEVALVYLRNIKYIENKKYDIKKLDKLVEIKKELIDNDLLIFDDNINMFLKGKETIVYGYDYISMYDKTILNRISAKIIEKEYKNYRHDIYEFKTIDEEVEFIANNIIDLINNKIDINNIKLSNLSKEYYNIVDRIFTFYNIPINLPNTSSIYDTNIVSEFLNFIKEKDKKETSEIIYSKYDMNIKENNYIYNKLVDILNKYTFVDNINDVIDMIIYDLKNTKNYKDKISNAVEVIDLKDNIIDDNTYVFLLSFNQGSIPIIHKDEDYITDSIKNDLFIETTKEKNRVERNIIANIIKSIKNLTITYKLKTPFEEYLKSSLIDDLEFNVIKNQKIINKYSNKMNYIHLADSLDRLIKYSDKDENLDLLYNNYSDIQYLKYNNKFTGINKEEFKDFIDNKLLLSYSSVDNYFKCSFRYYLNNILKLSEFESTFAINIGNIFHYVLSVCFNENFDFEKEFKEACKDMVFTKSDKFFLKKLKEELKFIIETIKMQNSFSTIKDALYENKIYINKEGNIKLTFMGIIDKLLYKKENDKTYLVIIDYKTGNPHTNLNNTIYGIDMQLPVYLYLANEKIKNAEVIGFYLQKILSTEIVKQKDKTYKKQKKDNLKLQGYSINNEELLSKFDSTYKSSEVIQSMKVSDNGFYAYSKTISKEEIYKLIKITENNINKAFEEILDCNFDINPKRIGKNLVGCEFCKYKDICYMKEEDIVNLDEYKNLEFLM